MIATTKGRDRLMLWLGSMGKRNAAVSLSEAARFRLTCKNPECQVSFEVSLARLEKSLPRGECPVCQALIFDADAGRDPIRDLVAAIKHLERIRDRLEVEAVFREPG
jgi:hypothetical protein